MTKKFPDDSAAAMLSHAADEFCKAVKAAITADTSNAVINRRKRKITKFIEGHLATRRWEERSAAIDAVMNRPPPKPPSPDDEARLRQLRELRELRERQAKEREREIIRTHELQSELITAGHRALAKKYHPDAGGNGDDMARLTRIRDTLKRAPVRQ